MLNHNSNFCSKTELTPNQWQYNRPQAIAFIEAQYRSKSAKRINYRDYSTKGINFALGLISILTLMSGVLLHRSVKATPTNLEITNSQQLSIVTEPKAVSTTPEQKTSEATNSPKSHLYPEDIELMAMKNAIATGNF